MPHTERHHDTSRSPHFVVIGIDDSRSPYLSPEVLSLIQEHRTFSGGARHLEVMRPYLPQDYTWIEITVPLSQVFASYSQYPGEEIVVVASGDPLFYGFAVTIQRELPSAPLRLYPYFNSLQLLAHRLLLPYHSMHVVSLTGRPWHKLDEALIEGEEMIGVLTDNKVHTPQAIAQYMLSYGYDNYTVAVGELLGNRDEEVVGRYTLQEVAERTFKYPNNLILQRTYARHRPLGLPEADFEHLNGRVRMITKMPIRLLSLSMLDLRHRQVMWDVGFCTGSVSIEAKLQFPHLHIVAFEQRSEGTALMEINSRRFGTPGIQAVIADFGTVDVSSYPAPDAVFIGGHGGKMMQIVAQIAAVLRPGGTVVFNSVSAESRQLFVEAISTTALQLLPTSCRIRIDDHNEIEVLKAIMPL